MMKKFLLALSLGIGCSIAASLFGHPHAFACSNACGYFVNNNNESAWCNVLPDTSIRWGGYNSSWVWTTNYPSYCWLNTARGNGHSRLYGVTTPAAFIGDVSAYLYESSGTGSFIANSHVGAAFLIDDMLGIDYHNGSSNGVNDARANFGNWTNRVNSFAANQCVVSTQPTCPGKSFGINWGYQPPYFCGSPFWGNVTTSAYDPWQNDTPFYTSGGNCDHDWRASIPEIVFFWTDSGGVVRSFHIGSQCGNVQESGSTLPPPNRLPTGTFQLKCDTSTGIETAYNLSISDPDAATTGYLTVVGGPNPFSYSVSSGTTYSIAIPASDTYPYGPAVTIALHAYDTGPLGSGADTTVFSVSNASLLPCAQFGCSVTVDVAEPNGALDPNMSYGVTVVANNSVGTFPSNTVSYTVKSPVGTTVSSGSRALSSSASSSETVTFSNLNPTGGVGVYAMQAVVSGGGLSQTCSGSFPVVYLPYLNVYGGDVMVGASPSFNSASGVSSCVAPNNNAGIFSWNNHNAGYSGAGTQYAAQALGQILDFATALSSTNTPPVGLSLANTYSPADPTKLDPTQGLFGGSFGGITADCDFTSDLRGITPVNPNPNTDLTITGHSVLAGAQEVYYVTNHDVYITPGTTGTNGIAYAGTGGWSSISQIPYVKVVVAGGDIYIDSGVTTLDGIYIAESTSSGAGGRIFTCASAIRAPWSPATLGYYGACHNKLTITGVFVAKQVRFLRTFGSIGQARTTDTLTTNNDAEVFNYTPEVWLPRGASIPGEGYTAITGLPPVL